MSYLKSIDGEINLGSLVVETDITTDTLTATTSITGGSLTGDSLAVDEVNINDGLITYSGTTGNNQIVIPDNLADGLSVKEGSNAYMTFNTTNSGEIINFYKQHKDITSFTVTGRSSSGEIAIASQSVVGNSRSIATYSGSRITLSELGVYLVMVNIQMFMDAAGNNDLTCDWREGGGSTTLQSTFTALASLPGRMYSTNCMVFTDNCSSLAGTDNERYLYFTEDTVGAVSVQTGSQIVLIKL